MLIWSNGIMRLPSAGARWPSARPAALRSAEALRNGAGPLGAGPFHGAPAASGARVGHSGGRRRVEAPMANPGILVLFHATLHRMVRSHGPPWVRTERAQAAIGTYVDALKRAAGNGSHEPADKTMVDRELAAIEDQLRTWKLIGGETARVCDGALAAVRRQRISNLAERHIGDLLAGVDGPGYSQLTRRFIK